MANCYNTGLESLCDGTIQWGTSTMYMMLVTTTYTFVAEHDFRTDITNEITNTGYTAGGQDIDNESIIVDDANDEIQLDCDNETWTGLAAGDLPGRAIIFKWTGAAGTDQLLCCCTLTTPPAPNGGDYTIVIDAEGVMEVANV